MVLLNDIVSPANRLVSALLRGPLHRVASGGLMILRWTGRSSGKSFSVPVGYQRHHGDIVVLLSKPYDKNWWKNFRTAWPAELVIKRTTVQTSGVVISPTDAMFYEHIERTLRRLPWMGSQFGGIKYDKKQGLTEDQHKILADHVAVVVFKQHT
jgi:hypothetical protein